MYIIDLFTRFLFMSCFNIFKLSIALIILIYFSFNSFAEEISIFETLKISDNQEKLKNCNVTLVALNKITSKSKKIILKDGMTSLFDNLSISVKESFVNPDKKESGSLISVLEQKLDSDPVLLFQGWIIAPKQFLSTMNHSIYEILMISCK